MADLFAGVLPFVRTAEERSFGRAAASLGITTAAVSKAVRKLEDELGVKLLDRSSRVVALTREGAVFFERCRPAVLGVQSARAAMQNTRREPQGELAVTLPFILAPFVVPGLARLGAQHPAPARPGELAAHNCLRFVGPSGRVRAWELAGGAVEVRGNLVMDHGAELLAAAHAGMGLCQVLDFMVRDALRTGVLVEVLADHAADGPSIHALATASRARSANVRAFIAFLVDAFRAA